MIVWLASYPRSGNTFLRIVLKHAFGLDTYSIYNDVNDIGADEATAAIVGHKGLPPSFNLIEARASNDTYFVKTHNGPPQEPDKAIYLIRDGRESVVSYWHYLKRFAKANVQLEDVIYGNVLFGLWGDHVQNWEPTFRPSTLLIKFEDITSNPAPILELVSDFLELPISSREIPSFSDLQSVNERFFRKGAVDSWRQEMTEEQELKFWLQNSEPMTSVYPEQAPSSELTDLPVKTLRAILIEQGTILRRSNRDLQENLAAISRQCAGLEGELIDIKHQARQLSELRTIRSPIKKIKLYRHLVREILGISP